MNRHAAAIVGGLALCFAAGAHDAAEHGGHDSHLGRVDFPIHCSQAAQSQFTRGLALLHHMTYPQARSAFEAAAAADAQCAMPQWGIAMTLFQPLWPTRPAPDALARGWAAVQKAQALPASPRERLFIDAAAAFFMEPNGNDYWLRVRRWAVAQEKAYAQLPNDDEIAAFYALSLLATSLSNAATHHNADRAADILLQVYRHNPDHPGAMHYLVHANDVPGRERQLLEITRKYDALAPDNPHALHMPTHIYTRMGDWDGVIRGNLRAADAALKYPAGEHREYVWDEFAHAIEYLVYAYLQQGDDEQAFAQAQRLRSTAHLEPTFKTAFHLASTQARCALERRDWAAAYAIQPRMPPEIDWDRYPWAEAVAWFARGLGAAHLGKLDELQPIDARLQAFAEQAQASGEDLFARNIRVLQLELDGWRAHAAGDHDSAIARLVAAAELEHATPKHPVTPGPTLPADELLGELYAELGRHADARSAYDESLRRHPNRFNSLAGAARANELLGDATQARRRYRTLLQQTSTTSKRSERAQAQQSLKSVPR